MGAKKKPSKKKAAKKAAAKPKGYTAEQQKHIDNLTAKWKKDLAKKNPNAAAEEAEILAVIQRISPGVVKDGVVQPCKKKPKKLNCIEPAKDSRMEFGEELTDAVRRNVADKYEDPKPKMRLDLNKISEWENNYGSAYVPWGPELRQEKVGGTKDKVLVPSLERDEKGLKGWKVGKYANNSGVSLGAGYDLGQRDANEIRRQMVKSAKESGLMTEEEAKALSAKLEPFAGKKRAEACQALRASPLTLSQREIDVVNFASLSNHLEGAIDRYESLTGKDWNDLSEEEQTVLMSRYYQSGNRGLTKKLAKGIANGDRKAVNKELKGTREQKYMDDYYDRKRLGETDLPSVAPHGQVVG